MNKLKIIKLFLVYLLFIGILLALGIILALGWEEIISIIDKIYKEVGLNTPSHLLTILEKESSFARNIGSNAGSKKENIKRCVNYCGQVMNGVYCKDSDSRYLWCKKEYETLEIIVNNLGLDINKVPFSPDFGMGYTQFQPTTWIIYPELKNKNPWNLEDSLYAAALKLKKDGINENLEKAISRYNLDPNYLRDYKAKYEYWERILTETISLYNCSLNDFSCALNHIKDRFPTCIENNRSIKQKKECLLTLILSNSILPVASGFILSVEAQRSHSIQVCPISIFGKGPCEFPSISEIIESVLNFILEISPVVLVILIVIGGIYYLLVSFNEEFIKKGHQYISHAIKGYILLLLISLIFSIISALLGGPSQENP